VRLTVNYVVSTISLLLALRVLLSHASLARLTIAEQSLVFSIVVIWSALTARIIMLADFRATDSVLTPNLANEIFAVAVAIVPLVVGFSMCLLCSAKRERVLTTIKEQALLDAGRKSRFLAMLSHELRTPLNAIVGHANMLKRIPREPAKHAQLCDTIEQAALSLADLANQVLLQAKGEVTPNQQHTITLKALIEPIVNLLEPLGHQKGLKFQYFISSGYADLACSIVKEPVQLVLKNLISNAIKYTQSGEVLVSVNVEMLMGNQVRLNFTVSDTGSGIAQDQLATLYDPFVTGEDVDSISQGSGLGLALCQQLLTNIGSRLDVESVVGEGSCFRFSVECEASSRESVERETLATVVPSSRLVSHVLVVEDVELNQKVIEHYLDMAQCKYRIAGTLKQAQEYLQRYTFDIVLLDMRLPDGHGLDWLQHTVPTFGLKTLPIFIALTGDVSHSDRLAYQQAGIFGCLDKPLEPQLLFSMLRQALGKSPEKSSQLLDLAAVDHLLSVVEEQYLQTKLMYLSDTYDYEIAQIQGLANIGADDAMSEKIDHLVSESAALGLLTLTEKLKQLMHSKEDVENYNWSELRQCLKQSLNELTRYCREFRAQKS
jgi:signal transduction histidine kinase/DNA-binding NarL/FixJ family response regulator